MFKQGLEGWAESPSHKVCDSFCHRVIPRNRVLMERMFEKPKPGTCRQPPSPVLLAAATS